MAIERERERGERRGLETKLSDVIHCVRASKGPPYPLTSAASTSESPSHGGATKLVRVSLLTEGYFQKMSIFLARAPVRPRAQAPVARAVSLRHRDLAPDSTAANPTPLPLPLPPPSVRPSLPLVYNAVLVASERATTDVSTSNFQLTTHSRPDMGLGWQQGPRRRRRRFISNGCIVLPGAESLPARARLQLTAKAPNCPSSTPPPAPATEEEHEDGGERDFSLREERGETAERESGGREHGAPSLSQAEKCTFCPTWSCQ